MTGRRGVANVTCDGESWFVTATGEVYPVAGFTTQAGAVAWARGRGYVVEYDTPPESAGAAAMRVARWAAVGVPAFWLLWAAVNGASPRRRAPRRTGQNEGCSMTLAIIQAGITAQRLAVMS